MLRLQDVVKRYGAVNALDTVSLEVTAGETVALIGPSGCGKSTLLRVMIGLVEPDRGSVLVDGQPLGDGATRRAQRRRMGYVIQSGGLFPHLTAHENVALPAHYARWTSQQVAERMTTLGQLVDLPAATLRRYPRQLSGGQRQRVSLMRALMLDPDILLLDEPLGALDPMIRYDLQRELHAIFRQLGKTVVLVTHDLAEARYFSQRLVLMRDGGIVQEGPFEGLVDAPADDFVSRFVAAQRGLEPSP